MSAYFISYDLGSPETPADYEKISKYVKSIGSWCKPLKSQWIVLSSTKTCSDIRTELMDLTDSNDKILVVNITGDGWASGRLDTEVTDWIKSNI